MFTIRIDSGRDGVYENIEDAISYMKNTNFENDVTVFDINTNNAYKKVDEIYCFIKKYNQDKPLNDQIFPTNPFPMRGIVGCLGVQAYSIGLGTYGHNKDLVALFTGYNDGVLDKSSIA